MVGLSKRILYHFIIIAGISTSVAGAGFAQGVQKTVSNWEAKLGARIGVLLRDVSSDWEIAMRADERFPMSSTFKALLCGAVLARVDAEQEDISRLVNFQEDDLVSYSPVTEEHVQVGMSVGSLCEATITISDNTAANLLLETMGGPKGLTDFLRKIGDATTRLDRWETELNEGTPGDLRDTTTPRAILSTLETLLLGDVLKPASAKQLAQWMIDDQVADALIRAHLPDGWVIGDKTGAGGFGSRSIIAFLQVPDGGQYLAAIYLTENDADFQLRNKIVSDIGRALILEIQTREPR
ncbi:class A beta-lactamase [Amylibacter sp. SFDW26]|uniref:class A beta-lactamase n=1 Tax=Amylibacter sp. SFDW26 TaxID=2652722 RepID=UPI00126196C6|nr:class A beta-lactamase [Amylibacter sp. SFDW26]KAB7614326.1 class A beta-lactamase [Amylibacter sp. SFDW26]